MESKKEGKYEVIIAETAEISFYEVLEYLYDNHTLERAEQIANELRDTAYRLHYHPERGTLESRLSDRSKDYRFVLYKRTSRTGIKVIYYIEHTVNKVYVTDFYPTEMDDQQIPKRSK